MWVCVCVCVCVSNTCFKVKTGWWQLIITGFTTQGVWKTTLYKTVVYTSEDFVCMCKTRTSLMSNRMIVVPFLLLPVTYVTWSPCGGYLNSHKSCILGIKMPLERSSSLNVFAKEYSHETQKYLKREKIKRSDSCTNFGLLNIFFKRFVSKQCIRSIIKVRPYYLRPCIICLYGEFQF